MVVRLCGLGLLACGLAGCGGGSSSGGERARATGDVEDGVRGVITFEKRIASRSGLSAAAEVETRPARHVRVEAVREVGGEFEPIAGTRTITGEDGAYGIGGAFPDDFRIIVYSTSEDSGGSTSEDAGPPFRIRVQDSSRRLYGVVSAPQAAVAAGELAGADIRITVADPERVAGAFNIVDTMQRAAAYWYERTEILPETATVNWESGSSAIRVTSFDRTMGDFGEIFVSGGVTGLQDVTDTDEFDDTVLAHEYCHFLVHNHATSASPGGPHGGEDLVPSLAFDEGLADWYSGVANSTRYYVDTLGSRDGLAFCLVCEDLETSSTKAVSGIGSEETVFEVLWDLVDGAPGLPADEDGDALTIPVTRILDLVAAFSPRTDYPNLPMFLERLVATSALAATDVEALLASPVNQNLTYPPVQRNTPPTGRDVFPIPIEIGQALPGRVDSITEPAGGLNVERGFNSIRVYRLELAETGRVRVQLQIDDSTNPVAAVTLYLLDVQNRALEADATPGMVRRIERRLRAGVYIVAVYGFGKECGDCPAVGVRASYTLEVTR